MISKPIVAPIKGDPMRASWGAAVAERANECADAIDAMRGPGGLASLREPKVETPSIFPFKVRFEPSTEENAEPHDGDFLIYIPSGSLTVDGHPAGGADFGLDAREGEAGWYVLPQISADAEWWLDFEYEPAEDPPLSCGMGTSPGHENPDDSPGMIARSVHIADLEFPENARPKVTQITKGPLVYEYFVDSINGLMGDVEIAADPDKATSQPGGMKRTRWSSSVVSLKARRRDVPSDLLSITPTSIHMIMRTCEACFVRPMPISPIIINMVYATTVEVVVHQPASPSAVVSVEPWQSWCFGS